MLEMFKKCLMIEITWENENVIFKVFSSLEVLHYKQWHDQQSCLLQSERILTIHLHEIFSESHMDSAHNFCIAVIFLPSEDFLLFPPQHKNTAKQDVLIFTQKHYLSICVYVYVVYI